MAKGQKSWAMFAAVCSLLAPLMAAGFGMLGAGVPTRSMKVLVGGAGAAVILAGFLVAIPALTGSLRQGRKGSAGLAAAGLGLNGLLLLGVFVLIPALARVACLRNAGYTLAGISNWDPPSIQTAWGRSLRPGPRVSQAAEPGPPTDSPSAPPAAPPAEPAVAPGHSEIRTFTGDGPEIPGRNSRLNYEFELSREPVLIHVPANYDGSTPFGLIVFLPGDDPFKTAPRGWDKALEQRRLLFISPQKALNSRDWDRRCALAVVCALKMRELYQIDPRRVYAAGYSGGGRMASRLGFYHPGLFSGTIQSCGSDFHRPVPAVKTVPLASDKRSPYGLLEASPSEIKAARTKVRFVLITGPGDFRYGHLLDIYAGGFAKDGFHAKLIDDPWMTHTTCDPAVLCEALDFIEQAGSH